MRSLARILIQQVNFYYAPVSLWEQRPGFRETGDRHLSDVGFLSLLSEAETPLTRLPSPQGGTSSLVT